MEARRIEGIMYGKFNAKDKRGTLLYANRKGVTVIDKPFKEVLKEVKAEIIDLNVNVDIKEDKKEESEIVLLWQEQIHKNYLKVRESFK